MALHLIIDGYNLIRRSAPLREEERQSLELGRSALIDQLAAYKRVRGHKITVVFDGAANHDDFEANTSEKGIRIRFSSHGQTADAVIRKMARREGEKALVVTADRPLASAVAAAGAEVVDPAAFEDKMAMAQLVETKGVDPEGEEDAGWEPTTRKKGPARRPPKRKRRQMRKVKKL
ncbi:MAG: NYN domain-containing protein [Desulfobacterales bacterium]